MSKPTSEQAHKTNALYRDQPEAATKAFWIAEAKRVRAQRDAAVAALRGVVRTLEAFSYTNQFGNSQRERLNVAKAVIAAAESEGGL